MTELELTASAIALMFDVEVAVALGCAAAWFELRQAERRSPKQADVGGVATTRTTPEPGWLAFALNPRFML